jgi:hypothetical protein
MNVKQPYLVLEVVVDISFQAGFVLFYCVIKGKFVFDLN